MRIYLAGKVREGGKDYRAALLPGGERATASEDWAPVPFRVGRTMFSTACEYVGPFTCSCDHGCYHGDNTHGNKESARCVERIPRKLTYDRCLRAIEAADLVFAWIDSADAYGTIFELGWATARGKHVVAAIDPRFDAGQLWFSLSEAHVITGLSVVPAFHRAIELLKKARRLSANLQT